MSEWKPGDVAVVTGRWFWNRPHTTERAIRDKKCWTTGGRDVMDHEVSDVRALVVIDPEDAEQVERLLSMYVAPFDDYVTDRRMQHMQAALREFANPTPRIEEPRGLGAVVEDDRGRRFTKHCSCGHDIAKNWRCDRTSAGAPSVTWSDINVVRVLSHGVTEGES